MEQLDATQIPLRPRAVGCTVPLTAWQLRLWNGMVKRGTRLSEVRLCTASVRVLGPLNISILRRSIETVVQRHESLRTRIIPVAGIPIQHIDPACEYHLEMIDLARVAPNSAEREATYLARQFVGTRIDLSVGPLFEAKLLRLSSREHVLFLGLDHMVSDAVSCVVLSNEIWVLYNQAAQGLPFSLPQLPVQFADYAVWQQRTYGSWLKRHEAYWAGRLTGAPRIHFPLDDGSAEVKHPTDAILHLPFGTILSAKLREVARHEGTLLPLVFLTIYIAVVSRWCNQRDLVLAFLSHGRHRRMELQNMIGFLANRLHFRIEVAEEDSFLDLLKRVNLEFYSVYQHQDFNRVPDFIPECVPQLYFNWIPANWTRQSVHQTMEADNQIKVQPFPMLRIPNREIEASSFTAVSCSETAAGIDMSVLYPSDLFAPSTIERLGHNLRSFAEEFTQRPLARVASLSFI